MLDKSLNGGIPSFTNITELDKWRMMGYDMGQGVETEQQSVTPQAILWFFSAKKNLRTPNLGSLNLTANPFKI